MSKKLGFNILRQVEREIALSIFEMTGLTKLAPSALPADDEIRQSWFFTLMGRTTAAVLLVFGYLAALGAIYSIYGEALKQLHEEHPMIFFVGVGGPLVLVFLFSVIPTIRRFRREQKLYQIFKSEGMQTGGYYRLRPYDEADADIFTRPDNALYEAVKWLRRTTDTVLYLSGASGTGKSSLVNAGITPSLRKDGWHMLHVRGMGDPMAALSSALRAKTSLFDTPPGENDTVSDMLAAISAEVSRAQTGPVLIILDQFEEYLILDADKNKAAYADLLRSLAAAPVKNVRLLHVFRSDYWEVLFKEALPKYRSNETGFGLAPFNRSEAEKFLRGGPQILETRGYDALFAGLDRIEDAKGIYRPITLNMIGYVLSQQGPALDIEPGRLIESYLVNSIAHGKSRDFAPRLLQGMITREGTKRVRGVLELAKSMSVEPWQITAALRDLEEDQIVRHLGDRKWEVSHDFLARLIGPVLSHARPGWLARNATPTLAMSLAGWLILTVVSVPAWTELRARQALDAIAKLPLARLQDRSGGLAFSVPAFSGFTDEHLSEFARLAPRLKEHVVALDLAGASGGLTDLSPWSGIRGPLAHLLFTYGSVHSDPWSIPEPLFFKHKNANSITDLSPLSGLPLTSLNLQNADGITDLSPLSGLPLTKLDISDADGITDLSPLSGLPLESLDLAGVVGVTDLSPLSGLPLTWLDISDADGITDLSPLSGLPLTWLDISDADGITDLSPLSGLPLESLDLAGVVGVTDLSPLSGLPLESLDLAGVVGVTDLSPLSGLPLTWLDIGGVVGVTDLSPLSGLPLTWLDIGGVDGITDLSPLSGLPLTRLDLGGADGITDLSPLKSIPELMIRGASDDLLRTLENCFRIRDLVDYMAICLGR